MSQIWGSYQTPKVISVFYNFMLISITSLSIFISSIHNYLGNAYNVKFY